MVNDDYGLAKISGASDLQDSAMFHGMLALCGHPAANTIYFFKAFDGFAPVRHPFETKYDMSRDQCVCLLAGFHTHHQEMLGLAALFIVRNKWGINKDIFSPSVRNHFRLCAGKKGTWLGYQWLKLDIWWNGKFGKIDTEQNQLLAMCLIAGPEYVKRYVKANPKWREQINYYWRDSFRQEPELAEMLIKKVEQELRKRGEEVKWYSIDEKLPKEYRLVLIQLSENKLKGMPPSIVAGYLKYSAGDVNCPFFVTPGCLQHRDDCVVTHWCDCLGDNFKAPLWEKTFNAKD